MVTDRVPGKDQHAGLSPEAWRVGSQTGSDWGVAMGLRPILECSAQGRALILFSPSTHRAETSQEACSQGAGFMASLRAPKAE